VGSHEIMRIGDATIIHARHQPGWRWSEHIKPKSARHRCPEPGRCRATGGGPPY
jgi:hypothetical protein